MKKDVENIVKSAVGLQQDLNALTMDAVQEAAPEAEYIVQKASLKELAKLENAQYIEPKRRLSPPLGKLPEKLKKQHASDWEYVKGIYENYVVNGEPITFSYCKYAGDADYMWEIPANVPVYVPRMIAKHLEECQQYHTFTKVDANADPGIVRDNELETFKWFRPTATHYRGRFRAIGAFA